MAARSAAWTSISRRIPGWVLSRPYAVAARSHFLRMTFAPVLQLCGIALLFAAGALSGLHSGLSLGRVTLGRRAPPCVRSALRAYPRAARQLWP